jgi:hypothetical protein
MLKTIEGSAYMALGFVVAGPMAVTVFVAAKTKTAWLQKPAKKYLSILMKGVEAGEREVVGKPDSKEKEKAIQWIASLKETMAEIESQLS